MKLNQILFAALPAILIGGGIVAFAIQGRPAAQELSAIEDAARWFNSAPLTAEQLKGKVVLADAWAW